MSIVFFCNLHNLFFVSAFLLPISHKKRKKTANKIAAFYITYFFSRLQVLFSFFYIFLHFPYLTPLTQDRSLLYAFTILRFNWIMAVGIIASAATWTIAVTGIVCIWNSPCNPGIKITSPRNAAPAANA